MIFDGIVVHENVHLADKYGQFYEIHDPMKKRWYTLRWKDYHDVIIFNKDMREVKPCGVLGNKLRNAVRCYRESNHVEG